MPTLTGATGNPLGAIIYVVLVSIVIVAIGYTAWMQGYARGRTFVTELLRSGTIDRVLVGAGVLGNMVLGALAAKFVVVNLAPTVTIAGAQLNIQAAVLDPLFPGALALGPSSAQVSQPAVAALDLSRLRDPGRLSVLRAGPYGLERSVCAVPGLHVVVAAPLLPVRRAARSAGTVGRTHSRTVGGTLDPAVDRKRPRREGERRGRKGIS